VAAANCTKFCSDSCLQERSFPRLRILLFFILIVSTIGVYLNSLSVPWVLDDARCITENPVIRSPLRISSLWRYSRTRFLTMLSFALDYQRGCLNVFSYHVTSITWHILTVLLVWLLTRFLLSENQRFRQSCLPQGNFSLEKEFCAWLAAMVFALHPLQTSAVTYISQRCTVMVAFFYLGTVLLYGLFRSGICGVISYAGAIFLMILAVLTKENSFSLPLALLLLEVSFFSQDLRRRAKYLVPFFLITLFIPLSFIVRSRTEQLSWLRFAEPGGTISWYQYLFTQWRVIITYLRLLVLPFNQNIDYDYPVYYSLTQPPVYLSFVLILFLICEAIWLYFRQKRLHAFLIGWFFVTLLVESSFIPIADVIFEHRLYLPMFSFSLAVASGCCWVLRKRYSWIFLTIILLILPAYGYLTCRRNKVWQSNISLWSDAVKKSPGKARPHNSLGQALSAGGRLQEAVSEFEKALELEPRYMNALLGLARTFRALGEEEKAMSFYKRALEVNPIHPQLRYDLALIASEKGDIATALNHLSVIVKTSPSFQPGFRLAGMLLWKKGELTRAERFLHHAISLKPEDAQAHNLLAIVYQQKGENEKALSEWEKACRLNPKEVAFLQNLGKMYQLLGRHSQAIQIYQQCLKLLPGNPELMNDLAVCLANNNQIQEAISLWKKILQANPDFQPAITNLKLAEKTFRGK